MGKRGRPMKSPFADLDEEFKEAVAAMSVEDIKKRVAEVALNLDQLLEAKKGDQDLIDKMEAAKTAGAVYREGTKMSRLKIRYAVTILDARGVKVSVSFGNGTKTELKAS